MKKKDLIRMLESLPEDAELVVTGYCEEILGEYNYNPDLSLHRVTAYKSKHGNLSMSISNYRSEEDKAIEVWEIH